MDIKSLSPKFKDIVDKYKYIFLVIIIGVVLMILPGTSKSDEQESETTSNISAQHNRIDKDLAEILSKIDGAGRVEVMLTVAKGEETFYQTDYDQTNNEQSGNKHVDTVIVTNSERSEQGLISRVDPEKYLGAVVLCQGADSSFVKLSIIEAISKITGLGADKICVLKMK